jgi:hypothetical protein
VAALTNGSLLWMNEFRMPNGCRSCASLDAGETPFRYVNGRTKTSLRTDGRWLAAFTKRFSGEVWLEVLLIGCYGMPSEAKKIAAYAGRVGGRGCS